MDYKTLCYGCFADKGSQDPCPHCGWAVGEAPDSALHLLPGTVLQDKYLLGRVLGHGGFGITYLAWDSTLNLKLAIKEYLPQQLAYRPGGESNISVFKTSLFEEFNYGLSKFLEEARTLARFNEHPNIVSVRDYFETNGTAYLVMNYHQGITLDNYLQARGGKISTDQARDIFMPVLDALKEVHSAGILHRDISPDNLLIDARGRVVLIDFGAARQSMGEKSKSMSVIMKAGYSPEEQYRSRGVQGPWTDIYALAATFYRAITGVMPPEALDRMADDTLVPPSQLGVEITEGLEQSLFKALAVKAKDRYHTVEEFQAELLETGTGRHLKEAYTGEKADKPDETVDVETEKKEPAAEKGRKWGHNKDDPCFDPKAVQTQSKAMLDSTAKPLIEDNKEIHSDGTAFSIDNKMLKASIALVTLLLLLLFGFILFNDNGLNADNKATILFDEDTSLNAIEIEPSLDISIIGHLDADYYIDYESGTTPIGDLPIGARVVDPSWEWEFRTGRDYTSEAGDETKPVTWIIVAKDHYDGLEPNITLLSKELIGRHVFDNSTDRGSQYGSNHWGNSGTTDATLGLRPWLNSTGIHSSEGFYGSFSENFKEVVLTTTLPNKERRNGTYYNTNDRVFVPSTTELGDSDHNRTYQIGSVYPYFSGDSNAKRVAPLNGKTRWYWTRSPSSHFGGFRLSVRGVTSVGKFSNYGAILDYYFVHIGVRPALNLKSDTMCTEIRN